MTTIVEADNQIVADLEAAATAAGMYAVRMDSYGHFRIYGGPGRAVNYYPFSRNRTANVDGKKGIPHRTVEDVINMAKNA